MPDRPSDKTDAAAYLEHACLRYNHDDGPHHWQVAEKMLNDIPGLAQTNIYTAAAAGDAHAIAEFLDKDPDLLDQPGGPMNWAPLCYAAYSRVPLADNSSKDSAEVLIERGADPNAHWWWGEQYKFTALTGVFGEGEGGPDNYPEHPDCEAFARLLLDAGADANDSQALYNRMFTSGHRCLELLLEYGLGPEHTCNWLLGNKQKGFEPNPQQTLHYQLMWAIKALLQASR